MSPWRLLRQWREERREEERRIVNALIDKQNALTYILIEQLEVVIKSLERRLEAMSTPTIFSLVHPIAFRRPGGSDDGQITALEGVQVRRVPGLNGVGPFLDIRVSRVWSLQGLIGMNAITVEPSQILRIRESHIASTQEVPLAPVAQTGDHAAERDRLMKAKPA